MKRAPLLVFLLILIAACNHPFQVKKAEIEIEFSSYDEKTGYVHIETSSDDPLAEGMELVIPLEGSDKRIALIRNLQKQDGGWFGSDKTSFDVYIPSSMKEKLLPQLDKGKKVTVRSQAGFTQLMSKSVEINRNAYIQQMELNGHKEQIKAMFEPAYQLLPTPRLIAEPGSSKMGGMPNLPEEIGWPMSNGRPMSFIIQLKLSDFQSPEDTKQGYIFLFMDLWQSAFDSVTERISAVDYRLIHLPEPALLSGFRSFPDNLPEELRIDETALRYPEVSMLPDVSSSSVRRLSLNENEETNYIQLRTLLETMAFTNIFNSNNDNGESRFLGYPETGTDIQLYCEMDEKGVTSELSEISDEQMDKLTADAAKWRLLMQLDFDRSPLAATGLAGKYYFMLKKKDIEQEKYENAVMYFESWE